MSQSTIIASSSRSAVSEHYDVPTLIFHWLTVVLVVVLFASALTWNYVTPHDRFWRPLLEDSHVSLGVLFAAVIVLRVVWRLTGMRRLPPEVGVSGVLSRIMYGLLYLLLVAQSASGFVLRWAQGEAFTFFSLFPIPALMARDRGLAETLEQLHNYLGWAIVILAFGHAVAALFHHYVLKDKVLDRMAFHNGPDAA